MFVPPTSFVILLENILHFCCRPNNTVQIYYFIQLIYKLVERRREKKYTFILFFNNSVQFSRSVVSDSLQPHGLQHTRLHCPSPTPRAQTHVHRVGDAIQPSHPLSSPSPPALNLSQHQGLFK